jgi:hypothetical protein
MECEDCLIQAKRNFVALACKRLRKEMGKKKFMSDSKTQEESDFAVKVYQIAKRRAILIVRGCLDK